MKKLIILLFSIFISINSYGGIFNETVCFETDGQNIVFLPNETDPYTGKYLCKYDNGQKEKEGSYKDGKLDGKWTGWYDNGQKGYDVTYKDGKLDGLWTGWYSDGRRMMEGTWKEGKLISQECWDEYGNEKECD